MPHFDELYPGRFLKGATLTAPRTIRIVSVSATALEGDKGEEVKAIIKYRDASGEGEIVWNRTNAILASKALGTDDYAQWIGKLITIHFDPTIRFGSETRGGIRVYGSPELAAPKRVEIKRPRRKTPEVYTLHRTDAKGNVLDAAPATAQGESK